MMNIDKAIQNFMEQLRDSRKSLDQSLYEFIIKIQHIDTSGLSKRQVILLQELIERLTLMLQRLNITLADQLPSGIQTNTIPRQDIESGVDDKTEIKKYFIKQNILNMIRIYNSGDRKAFSTYNPIRFGMINATQRIRPGGYKISPIIQQANDGELLGIKMEDSYIIIFPIFGLHIDEAVYKLGALEEIFECQGYKDLKSHGILEVIKPAVFRGDENHLDWPP